MKFALLGWHSGAKALVSVISQRPDDSLVAAAEIADDDVSALLALAPGVRMVGGWDELLTLSFDFVIVAGNSEGVLAGARQLAMERTPVVLVPQATQGSAFIYELTLTRDDNGVPLIATPQLPAHSLVEQLSRDIADSKLGQVQLLRLERRGLAGSPDASLTTSQIDAALLDDVAVLRSLGGDYSRVTAVHSAAPINDDEKQATAGVVLANVALGGESLAEATWSFSPGEPSWKLTVTGTDATASLNLDLNTLSGCLNVGTDGEATEVDSAVATGSTGQTQLKRCSNSLGPLVEEWGELTRCFETVEATHGSLRRKRTVELHFETTSERSIFKSQMTAIGCGLLLLTLFGLVAFLLLGALVDSRSMAQRSADADRRIIHEAEFLPGTGQLTESGALRISDLSSDLSSAPAPVFVMPTGSETDDAASVELDAERLRIVTDRLRAGGFKASALFVELATVQHPFVMTMLSILRIVWIAPLVLFLLLQLLILAARPSGNTPPSDADDTQPQSR